MGEICSNQKKFVSLQRIMNWRLARYRVKSWLRHQLTAWNTGGEGIHSPYLFEWVRMVMSDTHSYYVWEEIEHLRENMLQDERVIDFVDYGSGKVKGENRKGKDERRVRDIAKNSLASRKYAQMLSRLVNWLGEKYEGKEGLVIVELGTSLGITTAYLATMDRRNKVLTFEGCEAVAEVAKENWKELNISNIECVVGEIDERALDERLEHVDMAFIDANHTYEYTCRYFDVLAEKVHEKSVVIVDDIHHSEEMEDAWKRICADERVTSTMDLYQMGLVFFDKHYWRRNYKMRL